MSRKPDFRRAAAIAGVAETTKLKVGMDFRLPQYRREVFLRFYQFHLEHRTHPGCVYFTLPWLIRRHELSREDQFWLAFLNGNTQNIVTSWIIFSRFPKVPGPAMRALENWFNKHYTKLAWDTDRRYHKKDFIKSVKTYQQLVGDSQVKYFHGLETASQAETFGNLWMALNKDFYTFGRLSAFSYSEYLRIIGYEVDCPTLFLDDLSGSKSHRNGIAKVLGRDDLDWHDSGTFRGEYLEGEIDWLKQEALTLLAEARKRMAKGTTVDARDIGYFTLESALCTYKSWHRPYRRYPNVYTDMFHDRIKVAEHHWGKGEITSWWKCREECLPEHLRQECCFNDPGVTADKQNYYLETGHPVMMSRRWPEFDNALDRRIWRGVD